MALSASRSRRTGRRALFARVVFAAPALAWLVSLGGLAADSAHAQSQSVLDRMRERAVGRAQTETENRANQQVDSAVDKGLDCAFDPVACAKRAQTPGATPPPDGTQPAPAAADTTEWYAESQGKRIGPMPKTQLATMARSGELTPATLVWKEGMSGWTKAGEVPELGEVFAKVPPPLPTKTGPPPLPSR